MACQNCKHSQDVNGSRMCYRKAKPRLCQLERNARGIGGGCGKRAKYYEEANDNNG